LIPFGILVNIGRECRKGIPFTFAFRIFESVKSQFGMLILVSGLPASGKTTLAQALAKSMGAQHFNSDRLRNMMGLRGQYMQEDKEAVYHALLEHTREALDSQQDVIVDSTFYLESIREPFRRMAAAHKTPLHWVVVKADEETIQARLQTPRPDSEADFAVYQTIKAREEPLSDPHLTLWSDEQSMDEMLEAVKAYIKPLNPEILEP
jgi:predicted kinase